MKRVLTPFNILSLLLLALSAFAFLRVQDPPPPPELPKYGDNTQQTQVNVTLYFSDAAAQGFRTEQRALQVARNTPQSVAQAALAALVAGPKEASALRALPEGAELPQVWARGEHFFVNFPPSYAQLNYGTSGENMLICSVANTLLDLRGARDVTFLVGGKNVETLLGHLDLRDPYTKADCKS